MELDFSHLNKEQKQAVTFGKGPVLIVAGAGTGKTTVITYRLAYLIQQGKAKPEEILAVTFTDKAAEEMEERVDRLLPYGYVDLWVMTFHAFCKRILEEYGLDIGLSTDFKLLDSTASWLLVCQNLDRFKLDYYKPLGNPTRFLHALIAHFTRCKDQAIYPEDYLKYSQKLKDKEKKKRVKEVARAYSIYQSLLLENNLLDFGDLINYCVKLFEKRPRILKEYRNKFKYILVDEFQDTNWVQYELVKLLAAPKNNLTVCADDDQSIYKFRGASFGNIVQFKKGFPRTKQIVLTDNYRSSQDILDLSYRFIQQNNPNRLEYLNKIDKKLLSQKKGTGLTEHLHFKTLEQEAEGVLKKIIEILRKDKDAGFSDFAILVRANDHANVFARALERAGLPYQFLALRGLYSKPVILDIISYFKLLDNYHESSAVYRILNLPFMEIPEQDIAKITHLSAKKSLSIYQTLTELSLISGLSEKTIRQINFLLSLIKKHTKLATQKTVSEVFIAFLEDSGYLEYLIHPIRDQQVGAKFKKDQISNEAHEEARQDINYINQFYDKIKAFEESHLEARLHNFMEELNLELESGEQGKLSFDIEQGPDMVRLMTVHAAKGLEFKYVFLVNLVDRRFPVLERKEPIEIPKDLVKDIIPEGDIHLEEERRLFYVGMTRAKKGLFFTSAKDYGGTRKKKLSRFLKELGYDKGGEKPVRGVMTTSQEKIGWSEVRPLVEKEELGQKRLQEILPTYFSFTQLRAFENCPLQYKYAHIFKIPVRGKATFSYGKTMHNTLFEFVKQAIKKDLTLKRLLEIYKDQWIDEWYENQRQRKEYFSQGKRVLKKFYDKFLKNEPSILWINNKPALEQGFNLKIGDHTFIGKIDRIDKIGEGISLVRDSGDREQVADPQISNGVEIIDYKTGAATEKLTAQDKEQLLIYQLAAEQVFDLTPTKLTYYYVDEDKKICFLGKEQDKQKQIQRILSQIEAIKKSDFLATPGWQCKYCDFKDICEYAEK